VPEHTATHATLRSCLALHAKGVEVPSVCAHSAAPLRLQRVMDAHVSALLAGAPRRSAVFVDSDMEGEDGG
jgi:hypothetical protein